MGVSFNKSFPTFARPKDLVDSSEDMLKGMFFEDEAVFPIKEFHSDFSKPLRECGMKYSVDQDLVLERIRHYRSKKHSIADIHVRAKNLLKSEPHWTSDPTEIRLSEWLPVRCPDGNLDLSTAGSCRSIRER